MSLDGRLVGNDNPEWEEFYSPMVSVLQTELSGKGVKAALVVGAAGQNYTDQIGRAASMHQFKSYAACIARHGAAPDEPEPSLISHELNEMYQGRLPFAPFQHIINHSDSDGYYIPVDFESPFKFNAPSMSGGSFECDAGSSHALLRELDELNKYLKMPGDYGELCGSGRVQQEIRGDKFETEKWVWAVMRWLARESVEKNLLLEFC
ncbi:MAG: hypothetical protein K2X93_17330 [Candidatus Obscuribacterales bacterium]|nr:hypothetical protein [Candidatus Obscuribacterales bacterium]